MAKAKKVTFSMLEKHVDDIPMREFVIEDGVALQVKHVLGFKEAMDFVRAASEECFDKNGNYMPEVVEFIIRMNTLIYYAGLPAPTNYEKAYRAVMLWDGYEELMDYINSEQYDGLTAAIYARIAYIRNTVIQTKTSQVNEIIMRLNDALGVTDAGDGGSGDE